MNSNVWYMYVVRCADGTLYTGITKNISRRLNEHNYGMKGAKYTRSRRPVELLYTREYETHSAAASAEYRFKRLKRSEKLKVIGESR